MSKPVRRARISIVFAVVFALLVSLSACMNQPKNTGPLKITVWTYYNGDQLAAFNKLIDEFNTTVGAENDIVVMGHNVGSVEDLQDLVQQSANGKVGAEPLPNIFAAYADTAYAVDQMGLLADIAPYLSAEERSRYVEGYLEEGTLGGGTSIKIFPVAKSIDLLLVNKTAFEPFAEETGVDYSDLQTREGLTAVAEQYYQWTDAQTEEPNDGHAFFGMDSMANYFFIGAKQMGTTLVSVDNDVVTVDFDKQTIRRLWDNFYIPFVKGYFDATGRYRSDDVKTGNIIASVGSSSGATYFPQEVVDAEGESTPIEMTVLPCPKFEGGEDWAVQQGAGLAVINSSEEEVQASIKFLKWFTDPAQNTKFSVSSGYLPVTKEATDIEAIRLVDKNFDSRMDQILTEALNTINENELYTPHAFKNGWAFRSVLEHSLSNLAAEDAAAVRSAIEQGSSRDDALAPYISDEHFEEWYKKTKEELEELSE